MQTLIKNLPVPAEKAPRDIDEQLTPRIAAHLELPPDAIRSYRIIQRSIDARRPPVKLVYQLQVDVAGDLAPDKIFPVPAETADPPLITASWRGDPPLVIGTGPAGLFGALVLAMSGAKPLILEQGLPVEERVAHQKQFLLDRKLDENSNLLIGEGGAGTFSDGKRYTGTGGRFSRWIRQILHEAGAPKEILFHARPHVGSDYLQTAVKNLRCRIIALGGEFRFNSEVVDLIVSGGSCRGVVLANGERLTSGGGVLLAPGLGS